MGRTQKLGLPKPEEPKKRGRPAKVVTEAVAERFVKEFLVDLDATAAAKRSGVKGGKSTLATAGYRLLRRPGVAEKIRAELAKSLGEVEVTAERVLRELALIAFSDIRDFENNKGTLKIKKGALDAKARAVKSIEYNEHYDYNGNLTGVSSKVVTWDKVKALELLGKYLALFVDRNEHSGPGGGPIQHAVAVLTPDHVAQIKADVLGVTTPAIEAPKDDDE
jgi:phage terminase small subunit